MEAFPTHLAPPRTHSPLFLFTTTSPLTCLRLWSGFCRCCCPGAGAAGLKACSARVQQDWENRRNLPRPGMRHLGNRRTRHGTRHGPCEAGGRQWDSADTTAQSGRIRVQLVAVCGHMHPHERAPLQPPWDWMCGAVPFHPWLQGQVVTVDKGRARASRQRRPTAANGCNVQQLRKHTGTPHLKWPMGAGTHLPRQHARLKAERLRDRRALLGGSKGKKGGGGGGRRLQKGKGSSA